MASSKGLAFLAMLLVFVPMIAMGDWNRPEFYDRVCDEVECGKGTCVADVKYKLNYICQCDSGWKRTHDDRDDLEFLPCVIPDCTLNYGSCQPPPPPVPEKEFPYNLSFFDPCYWIYCGDGTCTDNRPYNHICTCNSGSFNLLNISYYPCYSQCTLGSDCANLGIRVANSEAAPGGSGAGGSQGGSVGGASQASTILPGKFHWMIILLMSMVMALRK